MLEMKWYDISADGWETWTEQLLTAAQAYETKLEGYLIREHGSQDSISFWITKDEEGNVVGIQVAGPARPKDAYQRFIEETGLNGICFGCAKLNHGCSGTKDPVWTGCVGRQMPCRGVS